MSLGPDVISAVLAIINSGVLIKLASYFLRLERRLMAIEIRLGIRDVEGGE